MTAWTRSEKDTSELRSMVDCPPEACVYRKNDLMAVIYCEADSDARVTVTRWHLYIAGSRRMPEMAEVLDARQELLPGIDDYAITPAPEYAHNCVHVWELIDPQPWSTEGKPMGRPS